MYFEIINPHLLMFIMFFLLYVLPLFISIYNNYQYYWDNKLNKKENLQIIIKNVIYDGIFLNIFYAIIVCIIFFTFKVFT